MTITNETLKKHKHVEKIPRASAAGTGRALPALRLRRSADQTGPIDPGSVRTGMFSCGSRLRHQDGSRDGADETAAVVARR